MINFFSALATPSILLFGSGLLSQLRSQKPFHEKTYPDLALDYLSFPAQLGFLVSGTMQSKIKLHDSSAKILAQWIPLVAVHTLISTTNAGLTIAYRELCKITGQKSGMLLRHSIKHGFPETTEEIVAALSSPSNENFVYQMSAKTMIGFASDSLTKQAMNYFAPPIKSSTPTYFFESIPMKRADFQEQCNILLKDIAGSVMSHKTEDIPIGLGKFFLTLGIQKSLLSYPDMMMHLPAEGTPNFYAMRLAIASIPLLTLSNSIKYANPENILARHRQKENNPTKTLPTLDGALEDHVQDKGSMPNLIDLMDTLENITISPAMMMDHSGIEFDSRLLTADHVCYWNETVTKLEDPICLSNLDPLTQLQPQRDAFDWLELPATLPGNASWIDDAPLTCPAPWLT